MNNMKAYTAIASAVALLLRVGNAQVQDEIAIEVQSDVAACSVEDDDLCKTTANRTCYNYQSTSDTECAYCLDGFIEYKDECILIDAITDDKFLYLAELIGEYLPEYANPTVTTAERAKRLQALAKVISKWNSMVPPPAFKLGLNKESFLTPAERLGRLGNFLSNITFVNTDEGRGEMGRFEDLSGDARKLVRWERKLDDVPDARDWHTTGYTTIVKNQGICGCCWAVSTAAAVESALMITGRTPRNDTLDLNSLSFQQMISCNTDHQNGCNGGNIMYAAKYLWENDDFNNGGFGGLVAYKDYPYSNFLGEVGGRKASCNLGKIEPKAYLNYPKVVTSVNDRSNFSKRKQRLMEAVAQQPVASVLKSNCDVLMSYKGGVLTNDGECRCCTTSCIDHAIVIVGYNMTAPTPYWKLRNSW